MTLRIAKIVGILAVVYALLVVAFESLLGYNQPEFPGTLVITTVDEDGDTQHRVLSGLESRGKLYVAVNHWPRAWYRRALANPDVQATRDGRQADYRAIPVSGEEHDQVARDNPTGLVFRIFTGFPPRHFLRLDPVEG